jgi:hypothetical protein
MCLESGDRSWLARLTNNINSLDKRDEKLSAGPRYERWVTWPTRTVTGMLLRFSSSVIKKRGYMAVTRKYNIQWYLSRMTVDCCERQ